MSSGAESSCVVVVLVLFQGLHTVFFVPINLWQKKKKHIENKELRQHLKAELKILGIIFRSRVASF